MNHVVKQRPWKLCWHALSETTSSASHSNSPPSLGGAAVPWRPWPAPSLSSLPAAGHTVVAVVAVVAVVVPGCGMGVRLKSSPMHMGHSGLSCDARVGGPSTSSTAGCSFFLALLYALAAGL